MKISIDKNFIPIECKENDELFRNGIFEWNITKMQEFIESGAAKDIKIDKIKVSDLYSSYFHIDQDHLQSVNIDKPVILAEIAPRKYSLIDGHHRILKAHNEGVESVLAYKVPADQHIPFLTSVKSYEVYIEYWNEKIKNGVV